MKTAFILLVCGLIALAWASARLMAGLARIGLLCLVAACTIVVALVML